MEGVLAKVDDLLSVIAAQQEQIRALTAAVERLAAVSSRPELGHDLTVSKLRELYEPVICTRAAPTSIRNQLAAAVEYFGDRLVLSLRQSEYVYWRDKVRAEYVTQRKGKIAPGTLNQEMHAFFALLNWGVREEHIARNPLAGKTRRDGIRPLPVDPLETVLSAEDEAAVLRAANPTMQTMFVVGVESGMRLNEIRLLEWSWIDLDRGRVRLPGGITKTRKGRTVRLTARAVDAVRRWPRVLGCSLVFPNPDTAEAYSKTTIGIWWRRVRDEAGLTPAPGEGPVRFHSATRHTAATRMAKVAPAKVVMRQLGQRSAEVFMRYAHADEDDLDEMQRELNASATERRPPRGAQRDVHESTEVKSGKATTR
jgi:integrase